MPVGGNASLNLQRLWTFRRVAHERSITRAAAALFLSQPAVSAQIRALEREVGHRLFRRTGRGVELTPAGEALLAHVERGLAAIEDGLAEVRADGAVQTLVVGTVVSVSLDMLPTILDRFHARHPQVHVVMRTGHSRAVAQMLLEGTIQVGFVVVRPQHEEISSRLILEDPVTLVGPPTHELAGRQVPLEALSRELVLLARWGEGFQPLQQALRTRLGEEFSPAVQVDPAEAAKRMVLQGVGLTFLGESTVRHELEAGQLARIHITDLPPLFRRVYVIWRGQVPEGSVEEKFLSAVGSGVAG
ncbi:MAG: LysR family transcriptional regulator [Armatimonadota bacterium]|nr:LysR family transcriptional regulator [Armatimonadota bacterium]MDR5696608.1 LysR family transcriptional regulator [Armatimonadota bacterium]